MPTASPKARVCTHMVYTGAIKGVQHHDERRTSEDCEEEPDNREQGMLSPHVSCCQKRYAKPSKAEIKILNDVYS